MKTLPKVLPNYTIEKSDKEPFSVKWEEIEIQVNSVVDHCVAEAVITLPEKEEKED